MSATNWKQTVTFSLLFIRCKNVTIWSIKPLHYFDPIQTEKRIHHRSPRGFMSFQNQRFPGGVSYGSEAIDIYVNGSISHIMGLSIRFNLFRNGRAYWNWTLCMCSFRECLACLLECCAIGDPYNALWYSYSKYSKSYALYSVQAVVNVFMFLNIPERKRHILRNGFVAHDHLMEYDHRRTVYFPKWVTMA